MLREPQAIELKNVSKWFLGPRRGDRIVAVNNLNLRIAPQEAGEFLVLLGPSGCGKTTILHLISGLLKPDQGQVRVFGKLVNGPDPHSVTVPQAYTCFPWLTASRNVEFGLALRGLPRSERRRIVQDYLRKVGLADRADAYPNQLSGGMQQRVAIARTLALKPPIVLMDEPFGALDAQTRAEMQQMILQLWKEEKDIVVVVFVTHDITEALLLADRIIVLPPAPADRIVTDLSVPFPRPRLPSLVHEKPFLEESEKLLQALMQSTRGGDPSVLAR